MIGLEEMKEYIVLTKGWLSIIKMLSNLLASIMPVLAALIKKSAVVEF